MTWSTTPVVGSTTTEPARRPRGGRQQPSEAHHETGGPEQRPRLGAARGNGAQSGRS